MATIEGKVVQDADRLDALGAIGVLRAGITGATFKEIIHDPELPPLLHATKAEYKARKGTIVNHFYEKLLLLKGRMKTETGKRLAEERHKYMEAFLEQFMAEWDGVR